MRDGPLGCLGRKKREHRCGENLKEYSARDIRFTARGDTLYAFVMAPPREDVAITTLRAGGPLEGEVRDIALLGSPEKVRWSRSPGALTIRLPATLPDQPVICFAVAVR